VMATSTWKNKLVGDFIVFLNIIIKNQVLTVGINELIDTGF